MLFEPKQNFIGLDISDGSLKAAQFSTTLVGQTKLVGLGYRSLPVGVCTNGEILQPEQFIHELNETIVQPVWGKFTTTYIVASLPESQTFIKLIDIPPMSATEITQAVKWEAEHHIPMPIEETYWDFEQTEQVAPNTRLPILLGVVPKAIVDSHQQILDQSGLTVLALEIEAATICRSLLSHQDNEACIIIDIGATRTGLILWNGKTIAFTVSLPISGQRITQTIAHTLNISLEEAEKAKIICGLDSKECHGAIKRILDGMLQELANRLHEAIIFYQEHFPGSLPVKKIILTGGGANFAGIANYISGVSQLAVSLGNPWCNLGTAKNPLSPTETISYTTALGLALRKIKTMS